jgi:hypothetical protein
MKTEEAAFTNKQRVRALSALFAKVKAKTQEFWSRKVFAILRRGYQT